MNRILCQILIFLFVFSNTTVLIAKDDAKQCSEFFSPFKEQDRHQYQTIVNRCFSEYGEYRSSNIKGHKHAGIDLRGKLNEKIYPIGAGKVNDIIWTFPNLAIAIIHPLANGETIYSLYVHIEDIQVKIGDSVDENTVIARLFNSEEFKKSDFKTVHLHLEIRKSMEDKGRASFSSMNIKDLNKYCVNPKEFLKKHLE